MFRDRRRRRPSELVGLVALLACMAIVLSACQSGATSPPATAAPATAAPATAAPATAATGPKSGGSLILARNGDIIGWDPLFTDDLTSHAQHQVYAGLGFPKADGSGAEAELAETWEINPNGKEVTFHLRAGLKYADGAPLKAADFVFSANRLVFDKTSPVGAQYPQDLKITAPDDRTVVFTTGNPSPALFSNLLRLAPYPEEYFKKVGAEGLKATPYGAGPFTLDKWERGQRVILKRNPNYWDQPRPYLDAVEIVVIGDANTRASKLQAGEIDAALDLPLNQLQTMQKDPKFTVLASPIAGNFNMTMNQENPNEPWYTDLKVRQAMNYAVDKDAIIKNVLFGFGAPLTTVLTKGIWVDPNGKPWPYDVAKAKQLMSESKYPNGFTTSMTIVAGASSEEAMATIIQQQLKEIGITINIQPLESTARRIAVNAEDGGGTHTYATSLVLYTNDGVLDNAGIFRFCCIYNVGNRHSNRTFYNNQKVNDMWAAAQIEPDPAKRADMFKQMQDIVWNETPFVYLYAAVSQAAASSKVHDLEIYVNNYEHLYRTWKDG